jgi:hypothetical protein
MLYKLSGAETRKMYGADRQQQDVIISQCSPVCAVTHLAPLAPLSTSSTGHPRILRSHSQHGPVDKRVRLVRSHI